MSKIDAIILRKRSYGQALSDDLHQHDKSPSWRQQTAAKSPANPPPAATATTPPTTATAASTATVGIPRTASANQRTAPVHVDVGGMNYTTTLETLTRYSTSRLAKLFNGTVPVVLDSLKQMYFLDRDGPSFRHILNFLRNGELLLPDNFQDLDLLEQEARYFELDTLSQEIDRFRHRRAMLSWNLARNDRTDVVMLHVDRHRCCFSAADDDDADAGSTTSQRNGDDRNNNVEMNVAESSNNFGGGRGRRNVCDKVRGGDDDWQNGNLERVRFSGPLKILKDFFPEFDDIDRLGHRSAAQHINMFPLDRRITASECLTRFVRQGYGVLSSTVVRAPNSRMHTVEYALYPLQKQRQLSC